VILFTQHSGHERIYFTVKAQLIKLIIWKSDVNGVN